MSWDAYNKKRKALKELAEKASELAENKNKTKSSNSKLKSEATKKIKNTTKKTHVGIIISVIIFALIGIGGGIFASHKICENDVFVVLGEKNIELFVGDDFDFKDEGVKIISFGRDISNKVNIKTNLTKDSQGNYVVDTSVEGEYYIIYTIDDIKYGNIQKVRTISILPTESSIDNQSTEVENG